MPRLTPIDVASATGKIKDIFQGPLQGKAFNIFRSMANSAAAVEVYLGMAGALKHAHLSAAEQEAIQLAVGQANGCDYCVAAHTAIGKASGLTEAQTVEARRGKLADRKLDGLVKFVLTVHEKRGHVSDADVAAVRAAGYGDGHIAEALASYALAIYTNMFNHVNQTPVDFPAAAKI